MSRPCLKRHAEIDVACPYCRWCLSCTEKGRLYRESWNEPEPDCSKPIPIVESPPQAHPMMEKILACKHRGEKTGGMVKCDGCGCRHKQTEIELCSIHGLCTQKLSVVKSLACCLNCKEKEAPDGGSD